MGAKIKNDLLEAADGLEKDLPGLRRIASVDSGPSQATAQVVVPHIEQAVELMRQAASTKEVER
jgi:hypothetical protein